MSGITDLTVRGADGNPLSLDRWAGQVYCSIVHAAH
jgi:glutathione peroxidase